MKDIRRAGEHVAGLKKNRHIPNGKTIWGVYKGVREYGIVINADESVRIETFTELKRLVYDKLNA